MDAEPQVWTEVHWSVGAVRGEVLWAGWKCVKRGVCCYMIQELQTRITRCHIARSEATLYFICLRWGRGYALQFVGLGAKACSLRGEGCVWGLFQMPTLQTPAGWVCQCSACEQWGTRTSSQRSFLFSPHRLTPADCFETWCFKVVGLGTRRAVRRADGRFGSSPCSVTGGNASGVCCLRVTQCFRKAC